MTQDYKKPFNLYPVFTSSDGFEGAQKRYQSFPTPTDAFNRAMIGLPRVFPLTKEPITQDLIVPYLESAVTEIELSLNMCLTPTEHFQSFDYIDGMFERNFTGMNLQQWPATCITRMSLKYPHTTTPHPYQQYTIPPNWLSLYRNKLNVIAAFGAISVTTDASNVESGGGVFSYVTGFGRGPYQPNMIEVVYTAGWENDKLPSVVWDLIVTLTALRFLQDIAYMLFPYSSTSVTVDSVTQSASIPNAILAPRLAALQDQYDRKKASIMQGLGRTIKLSFIGA
jgi:hypothetical protein